MTEAVPIRRKTKPETGKVWRLRALPAQLEVVLKRNLVVTPLLSLTFVAFGVTAAILLGRIYGEPLLNIIVLVVAGYFAI